MPIQRLPGNPQFFTELPDGRPLFQPRARAEPNPATVLSEINFRSNSESALT